MFLVFLSLLTIASAMPSNRILDGEDSTNIHAVLFATAPSSSQWNVNYAPEAEVARTYHWLIDHGVPADNIVLFMSGDFANNEQNPFPGSLYTDVNKSRNYADGLKIDYSGAEVNPDNYLAVLRGEADKVKGGTGRVLKSTDKNRVFVSHESHGDSGVLIISDQGYVTTKALNEALKHMNEKKMFKELVYYIMACYSGSMFNGTLDENGNVYAMTAAHPDNGTSTKDYIKGEKDGISYILYISSQFGDAWMDNAEECDSQTETLEQQYKIVVPQVKSGPMQFGNMNIAKEPIGNFEGPNKKTSCKKSNTSPVPNEDLLPIAPIAEYLHLKQQLKKVSNGKNMNDQKVLKARVDKMEAERAQINTKIDTIISAFVNKQDFASMSQQLRMSPGSIAQMDCHHDVTTAFWNECKEVRKSAFVNDFYTPIVQLCENNFLTQKIIEQIKIHCY